MTQCSLCKKVHESPVQFCQDCGKELTGEIALTVPVVAARRCTACGQSDPMNESFCTFCGETLPDLGAAAPIRTTTSVSGSRRKPIAAVSLKGPISKIGAAAAVLAITWGGFSVLNTAHSGLLIHALPADATVVIQDEKGFVVSTSRVDQDGIFKNDALAPGKYRIVLTAAGCESRTQDMDLVPGRTKALGMPDAIVLKPLAKPPVTATAAQSSPELGMTLSKTVTNSATVRRVAAVPAVKPTTQKVVAQTRTTETARIPVAPAHKPVIATEPPPFAPMRPQTVLDQTPDLPNDAQRPMQPLGPGRMHLGPGGMLNGNGPSARFPNRRNWWLKHRNQLQGALAPQGTQNQGPQD